MLRRSLLRASLGGVRCRWYGRRQFSGLIPQHQNSKDNTEDTPFDFTEKNYVEVEKILARYPSNYKQSATIPLLWLAQRQSGNWVSLAAMNKIAEILEVNPMRVYEVCTFYTMFNRKKLGKFHLQLCTTTPCALTGAEDVRDKIKSYLNLAEGDTSPDGLFTYNEVECLGACVNAPMMQVNNELFYEDLNVDNVIPLLDNLKSGTAKIGPQNGRIGCIGPLGQTTLKTDLPPAPSRDFAQLKAEVEAENARKAAEKASEAPAPK